MDQYSFHDYDNLEESQHFSDIFLNESQVQQKIQSQEQRLQNMKQKNQKLQNFPTNFTSFNQQISHIQSQKQPPKQIILQDRQKKERKIRKIETSKRIEIRNKFTFSGSKNDTVELNTNFKTLFIRFIRQSQKEKSQSWFKFIAQFEKGVSSFKAFSQLYNSNIQLKKLCKNLIRSSLIIKKVMRNRAKFWMRLQMIKYIQALNLNVMSRTPVRWKSIRKQIN